MKDQKLIKNSFKTEKRQGKKKYSFVHTCAEIFLTQLKSGQFLCCYQVGKFYNL